MNGVYILYSMLTHIWNLQYILHIHTRHFPPFHQVVGPLLLRRIPSEIVYYNMHGNRELCPCVMTDLTM